MSEEAMRLLEGTQDVFLTDFKYGSDACALRLSKVKDYTSIVKRNHRLAKVQGELIVRHLVLPNHLDCCTKEVADFIAKELGVGTRFNLMFQYRPMFKAHNYDEINRRLTTQEISDAQVIVKGAGLKNVIS
jgi:putative pyruvate formate lyase activating enzyme